MRALVVTEPGKFGWQDVPEPKLGPYDALVDIEACGICSSTDRKLIDVRMSWQPPPPFVLGHEAVGRVTAVGDRVHRFAVGDRVTRPVAWWPGEGPMGIGIGGFAERGIVRDHLSMANDGDMSLIGEYLPERQVVLPGWLAPESAVLGVTLAETASVLASLPVLRHRRVAVTGTGCAGLSFVLWAKLAGAHVTLLGRRTDRLEKARELGADRTIDIRDPEWPMLLGDGGRIDVAIETTCAPDVAGPLARLLPEKGLACAYGAPPEGESYATRWITASVNEHLAWPWVADLLRRGWIDPAWFITHRFAADDVASAFDAVARGEVVKAVVGISAAAVSNL
jgi:threonine dehydrogenase-like Zn-dependent dehydrogenase